MRVFTHTQSTPSLAWTINHNLDCAPTADVVILLDGLYVKTLPTSIIHLDNNTLLVEFSTPRQGVARLVGLGLPYALPAGAGRVDLGQGTTTTTRVFDLLDDFNGTGLLRNHSSDQQAGMTGWVNTAGATVLTDKAGLQASVGEASIFGGATVYDPLVGGFNLEFTYNCTGDDYVLVFEGNLANTRFEVKLHGSAATVNPGQVIVNYGTTTIASFAMSATPATHKNVPIKITFGPAAQSITVDAVEETTAANTLVSDLKFTNVHIRMAAASETPNSMLEVLSFAVTSAEPGMMLLNLGDYFNGTGAISAHTPDTNEGWGPWTGTGSLDGAGNLLLPVNDGVVASIAVADPPGASLGSPAGYKISFAYDATTLDTDLGIKFSGTLGGTFVGVQVNNATDLITFSTGLLAPEEVIVPVDADPTRGPVIDIEWGYYRTLFRVDGVLQGIELNNAPTWQSVQSDTALNFEGIGTAGRVPYLKFFAIEPRTPQSATFSTNFNGAALVGLDLTQSEENSNEIWYTWADGYGEYALDGAGNLVIPQSVNNLSTWAPDVFNGQPVGFTVKFLYTPGSGTTCALGIQLMEWMTGDQVIFMISATGGLTLTYGEGLAATPMTYTGAMAGQEIVFVYGPATQTLSVGGVTVATGTYVNPQRGNNTVNDTPQVVIGSGPNDGNGTVLLDYLLIEEYF